MMASVKGRRSVTLVPAPGLLAIVDGAAQRFHLLPDHVHAHAAPGDIGDLLARWKSRAPRSARRSRLSRKLRAGRDQAPARWRARAPPRTSMPPPSSLTPISTLAPECRAER